jgi:hypothetical protein
MKSLILPAALLGGVAWMLVEASSPTLGPKPDLSRTSSYTRSTTGLSVSPSVNQSAPVAKSGDRYISGEIAAIDRAYERGAIDWDQKVRLKCAAYSAAGQMSADFKGCN